MSATLDVNILVYAADVASPRHARARALLEHVAASSSITYLFWPVLLGYMRIITHAAMVAAPVTPEAALADIDDLIRRPRSWCPGRATGSGKDSRVSPEPSNLAGHSSQTPTSWPSCASTVWPRFGATTAISGSSTASPP